MSEFAVRVKRIRESVVNHPNADRLSIVRIDGYEAITQKNDDGSHRYTEGDHVIYIPEAAVLPEWLLRRLDFWNESEGKGTLAGPMGNRVRAMKLRGIFSQGLLHPVNDEPLGAFGGDLAVRIPIIVDGEYMGGQTYVVSEGQDVAKMFGITKYEPPIPTHMAGEVCNVFGHTMKYDFENWQSVPDMFEQGERVVATEKLHGTNCQIGMVPGLNHPELFADGDMFVGSKGLSAQGLVFKDNETNTGNLYVKALRSLLDRGFAERMRAIVMMHQAPVHIFGEIFGRGVQDLSYGFDNPVFRVFDIAIGDRFLDHAPFTVIASLLGLETVPVLYEGAFDAGVLKEHRDGKTSFGGVNIREGIVVKAMNGGRHPVHGRKIVKMVSPSYTLRKSQNGQEVTDYN